MGVGCVGDTAGYFPTDRQADEGGYEGADWIAIFGMGRSFKPGLDELWSSQLDLVARHP